MFDIINVIDFFQETKSKYEFNDYEGLKELILNSDSQFIDDCVLLALYGYVKPLEKPFNTFMSNKDVLSFLSSYEDKKAQLMETYKEEFSKLESFLFQDVTFVKNKIDFIPYLVVEGMLEYKSAKKKFIPNVSVESGEQTVVFRNETIDFRDGQLNLSAFADKDYGYYVGIINPDELSNYYRGSKQQIISNQPEGLKIYDIHSEVSQITGFRNNTLEFSNLFKKKHLFEVDLIEAHEQELQLYTGDKEIKHLYHSFVNKLVLKTFIYFANLNHEKINNVSYLGYKKSKDNKSNFPAVITSQSREMPYFSFEDLKFKGQYDFLSFLDDWFEDILDLDFVNYYSDQINSIHFFEQQHEWEVAQSKSNMTVDQALNGNYVEMLDKFENGELPYFSKEYCNNLRINIINEHSFLNSQERSGDTLTPINPYFSGTEEEMREYAFKIAKANKLKLYNFYMRAFQRTFELNFHTEMKAFLDVNIVDLMEDEEWLNNLERIGIANISPRNWGELGQNGHISVLVNEDQVESLVPIKKYERQIKSVKDVNFVDYKGKSKATQWATFHCRNINTLSILEDKYFLKLSKESQFFIDLFKADQRLKVLRKAQSINGIDNLFRFRDYGVDIELYIWFNYNVLLNIVVPMSKGNKEKFVKRLDLNNIDLLNCSFGYSNGSREYY